MKKEVICVIGILAVIGGTTAIMLPKPVADIGIPSAELSEKSVEEVMTEPVTEIMTETATKAVTEEATEETAEAPTESTTEAIMPVLVKRSEREHCVAVSSSEATKESIFHMMLNTVDYFSKVSGTVIISSDFIEKPNCVTFQSDLDTGYASSYQHSYDYVSDIYNITCDDLLDEYRIYSADDFYDNETHISIDHTYKTYMTEPDYEMADYRVPDEQRVTTDNEGNVNLAYRADLTKVPLASRSLFPQGFTAGALHDFSLWNIEEITELDGNECFQITGTPEASYAGKTRIHNYEMYVNTKNGCIMKLQGFNENGELVFYVYTDDLRFDDEAQEHKKAPAEIPEGYRKVGER